MTSSFIEAEKGLGDTQFSLGGGNRIDLIGNGRGEAIGLRGGAWGKRNGIEGHLSDDIGT